MAEEAIRIRARAEALRAELDRIDRDTEKKLEALRQKSIRRRQINGNASQQNGNHQPGDDGGIGSSLLGANADILMKYHLLREDEINSTRSKEHDGFSTATRQDNRDDASLASQGKSILSISDTISEPVPLDLYPESEDIKSWMQDSDDKEENEALSQQGIADSSPSKSTALSLIPDMSPPMPTTSSIQEQSWGRKHPSKQEPCQQKINGPKSVSKSDEAEKAEKDTQCSDASDSDIIPSCRRGLHSKSGRVCSDSQFHLEKGKWLDTDLDRSRRRSLVHPSPASQPAGTGKNPIDLEKDQGSKRETIPTPRSVRELAMIRLKDKGPEKNPNSNTRRPLVNPAKPLVRPAISQLATINESPVRVKKREEKNQSSEPRNLPVRQVSASQPATTSKSRAGPEKDKSPEKTTTRRPFGILATPLVRPAVSQPASSTNGSVKVENGKVPERNQSSTPRRSLVLPVSASQPVTGSKRARSPSPHTPEQVNSPEMSQPSSRRRQPPRSSVTPVPTYNDRRNFRNMVGTLEGPEYRLL
ncbi:hypothetical protein CHU98_g6241 [Xylaria longipes]|nr:hypothetical protein CHU98_g6241 [Xylaria longipes]